MQRLENIKHDRGASPKCDSNLIKANSSFHQRRRLWHFFFHHEQHSACFKYLREAANHFLNQTERDGGVAGRTPTRCAALLPKQGQQLPALARCHRTMLIFSHKPTRPSPEGAALQQTVAATAALAAAQAPGEDQAGAPGPRAAAVWAPSLLLCNGASPHLAGV